MPYEVKKHEGQHCVFKKGDSTPMKGGCHPTREEALKHQRALYANVAMSEHFAVLTPVAVFADIAVAPKADLPSSVNAADNTYWVQAFKEGTFQHKIYGEINLNERRFLNFANNFHSNVTLNDLAIDYEHGMDVSKGLQAAGWVRDVRPFADRLDKLVEFTDEALKEIRAKKWRYYSSEFSDVWERNDGMVFEDVLHGGAITNHPFLRGMAPLNFSELLLEGFNSLEFADWSTKFKNTLPDSAFLYVESGGHKDAEGKTTPRDKRHFPYKDAKGNIDLPHIRNAIARIPQAEFINQSQKDALQERARNLLSKARKAASEGALPWEIEAGEPGSGQGEPQPRTDGEPDKAAEEGWRRDTPPIVKELNVNEFLKKLAESLGIAVTDEMDDAKLNELINAKWAESNTALSEVQDEVKQLNEELQPLRDAQAAAGASKTFREQFPEQYDRMQQLVERDREVSAKEFSSLYERFDEDGKPSTKGLSALALDKVADLHKKLSDRTATLDDLKTFMDTLTTKAGIVDYGEKGSSRHIEKEPIAPGTAESRKQFADLVKDVMTEDNLEFEAAIKEAARRDPELAEAYRHAPAVR